MSDDDAPRSIDDLVAGNGTTAMVMTMVGATHTSRPVTIVGVEDSDLVFLVDRRVDWVQTIERGDAVVHVTVSDDRHSTYLSLNGRARIDHGQQEKERFWNPVARTWFEGPEDENLGVLMFTVDEGDYWDGPNGRLASALALFKSMVTKEDSALGDRGRVTT